MILSHKKLFLLCVLIILALSAGIFWLASLQPYKIKLLAKLIRQPLDTIRLEYAHQDCHNFNDQENQQGYFEAFVTGYCKPQTNKFKNRQDFLCAVGLNCSCPKGRQTKANCAISGSLTWASCLDFDDTKTDYCNQTASQSKPGPGQVAADWSCFPANTNVTLNNQSYLVTDKGSAITGRRFDIWFANCDDAFKATGIYKVQLN